MPGHDIVTVATSAGGVEVLKKLVSKLPSDLPAAISIVLHMPANCKSVLLEILNRAGQLSAVHPVDGQAIKHGNIYIAPPDNHLLIKRGYVHLFKGPKVNNLRPAADPLFRTAAYTYGPRVVGVVLTGFLYDGTAGLITIKSRGGITIAQDPDEAVHSEMPRSALKYAKLDYCLPLNRLAQILEKLSYESVAESSPVSKETKCH